MPRRSATVERLRSHGFELVGMGGNLTAYCRKAPDTMQEARIVLEEMDASTAPDRQSDRVVMLAVDLTLEAEGHSDDRAYREVWRGTLRTLLARLDRAQDARMLGALTHALEGA